MADAMVERRPSTRFFCHRCNIEFEDVLQEFVCPYCASGFIEQVEIDPDNANSGDDFSDADMSNLDDSDDHSVFLQSGSHPVLNDIAFLMSAGQVRGGRNARPESVLEHLVWNLGGAGGNATATVGGHGGTPFVLVGAPGDYVFGGEGLDAVVTQLLGQLENTGPPPLTRDQIASIPSEAVTSDQAAANSSCSVCWDNFQQGENVSRLECDHIFHPGCIEPWLRLHATCPICRRSLMTGQQASAEQGASPQQPREIRGRGHRRAAWASFRARAVPSNQNTSRDPNSQFAAPLSRVLLRRIVSGNPQTWDSPPESSNSSSSTSVGSSVTTGGVWAPHTRSSNSTSSNSSTSLNSNNDRDRQYNMDIDFD